MSKITFLVGFSSENFIFFTYFWAFTPNSLIKFVHLKDVNNLGRERREKVLIIFWYGFLYRYCGFLLDHCVNSYQRLKGHVAENTPWNASADR